MWVEIIKPFLTLSIIQIQALTAWAEARGEGDPGMQAIINVIRNRVKKGGWFIDNDISKIASKTHGVCLKKYQFSCYLQNDPNFEKLISIVAKDEVNRICQDSMMIAIEPELQDLTQGALYYHAINMKQFPSWSEKMQKTVIIKHHIFYKDIVLD